MAQPKPAQIRVGISGWTYAPWRGVFYPSGLAHARELSFASRAVNSVEINGTFYSLQRPSSYQTWYAATPADFVFAVKGGRFITHLRRLREVETPLANFFASGLLGLKEKLGPILWQFPPNLPFDAGKLRAFFDLLPRDTAAAATLARRHDEKISKDRALTETDANRPLRYAVEVRHASFESAEFIDLLRERGVALVVADTAGKWPYAEDVTADFVYARLHGDEELYVSGYTPAALDRWAERFTAWAGGREPRDARRWGKPPAAKPKARDVYVYFDNDVKVRAPFDAIGLAERLGISASGAAEVADAPKLSKKALAERVRSQWPGVR